MFDNAIYLVKQNGGCEDLVSLHQYFPEYRKSLKELLGEDFKSRIVETILKLPVEDTATILQIYAGDP
jgi:hypothetical protein